MDVPEDRTPFERLSSAKGKTTAEVAAFDRFFAGLRERVIAEEKLALEIGEVTGALRNFAAAWQVSEDRITTDEARQVASHPDLAEVNVRLDALYDLP